MASTFTIYKNKATKVHPLDNVRSDGSVPKGTAKWKLQTWEEVKSRIDWDAPLAEHLTPKFSTIEPGSRLTEERIKGLMKDIDEHLSAEEQNLLLECLRRREAALA